MSTIFSKYRFKYLRFRFLPYTANTATAAAYASFGVLDDGAAPVGETPITTAGVMELRCSGSAFANQTVPTQFEWRPVDPAWRFTSSESSGGDIRLTFSGYLFGVSTIAATASTVEVDYCVVFKDAVDAQSV